MPFFNIGCHPIAALVLAIAGGCTIGGLLAFLVVDLIVFAVAGHTFTASHAMMLVGQTYPYVKYVWLAAGLGLTVFFYWHFWGWTL